MDVIHLTSSQKRLWIEWKINPTSPAYNLNLVFKLTGNLNVSSLQESLDLMIKKHEAFRTYFIEENGEPFQIILSPQDKIFDTNPMVSLDISSSRTQTRLEKCIKHETHKPFDLKMPLPYRFYLIKASMNVHYFIFTIHHIISDGASLESFVRDLSKLYNNEIMPQQYLFDADNTLSQYLEYANDESTLKRQAISIEYWKNLMSGIDTRVNFHVAQKSAHGIKSANFRFSIQQDLRINLENLALAHNTTTFVLLMTAFDVLLYRYFNSKNLAVGYAINIRPKHLKHLFGFYVNNIPLKTTMHENQIFSELLALNSIQRKNDRQHQELSLQEIVKTMKTKSDANNLAPFNVSFNQVSSPVLAINCQKQGLHLHNLEVEPIPIDIGETHFDLSFLYANSDEQLEFSVDYRVDIFEDWFIKQMTEHFLIILKAITQDPNQCISHIALLTKEEEKRIFSELRGPEMTYPEDQTPTQLFESNAKLFPEHPAIIHNEYSISYQELNEKANQLAQFLLNQHFPANTLIAVGLERSIDYITSIIGIMKAGYAYVPIDPKYPEERIKFILKDTDAPIFIVRDHLFEQTNDYSGMLFSIKDGWNQLLKLPTTNPQHSPHIYNTAYTIYTSGTTGIPKGVQISIQSLLNLIFWHKNTYLLDKNCRASVVAGVGFDASVWEIWPYLANGSTLHIADQEIILDAEKLIHWLIKEKINISFLPTPLAELLLKKAPDFIFSDLRFVLTGGEQLKTFPPEDLSFKLFNHYGPTENTVVTTYMEVLPMIKKQNEAIMPGIGKPIANVEVYVLDYHRQPVPSGVIGELYIGGPGVAHGYLNQANLTNQSFISNPFFAEKNKILYKTGDLIRYQSDGSLDFVGRIDEQIKLRGFRIELTEIETQLLKNPLIEQCAVLIKSDGKTPDYLVAYFVASDHDNTNPIDTHKLQEFLGKFLPNYMVPSSYVSIDKMPLTLNGKIDKKALLALDLPQLCSQNITAPRTKTEKKLLQIWSKVLNINTIGIFDNFFALGGHSLLISAVILSVKKSFSVDIPFRNFFEKPTIANLAHLIDTTNDSIGFPSQTVDDDTFKLRKTIILDEDIQVRTPPTAPNRLENLLLTGSSGFLGAFLLSDLYHLTKAKIYCLVRGNTLEEATKKLQANLMKYNLDLKIASSERIEIILGDLSKPQLGLNDEIYKTLLEKVDAIYHSGAQVHHIYSYDVLEAANVFSTIEIIKLASLKNHKHIHYVSAVSGARENLDEEGFIIEDFLKETPGQTNIRDGYNQTKLVSELLLGAAKERGMSVNIYRPAWIGGHSSTGDCALENQHLFLLIKGCIQMGYAPDWNMELNIVPVDFISKFITLVSTSVHIPQQVFNLVNFKPIYWLELMDWIKHYGYKISVIPKNVWRNEHLAKIKTSNALYPLVSLYISGETSKHTQKQIQGLKIRSTHTQEISHLLGLSCPKIDNILLECYFKFLINTSFIPAPAKKSVLHKNLVSAESV